MQLTRGAVARALAVAAPWTWFLVRVRSVVFELVAVLLPLLVAVAVLVGLATRRRWLLAPAASVLALGVVAVVGPWLPATPAIRGRQRARRQPPRRGRGRRPPRRRRRHRRGARGDRPDPRPPRRRLRPTRFGPTATTAPSASDLPVVDLDFVPGLLPGTRQQRIEVDGPGGRFVLWAVHLPKPWFDTADASQLRPGGHARKLDAFLAASDDETRPVVIAGDTNLDDALRGTWGGPTARKWYPRPLLLRVDHVFVPEDWYADRAGRFALAGSDHRAVRVRVGPCRD